MMQLGIHKNNSPFGLQQPSVSDISLCLVLFLFFIRFEWQK